jgi:hypothetical protein
MINAFLDSKEDFINKNSMREGEGGRHYKRHYKYNWELHKTTLQKGRKTI